MASPRLETCLLPTSGSDIGWMSEFWAHHLLVDADGRRLRWAFACVDAAGRASTPLPGPSPGTLDAGAAAGPGPVPRSVACAAHFCARLTALACGVDFLAARDSAAPLLIFAKRLRELVLFAAEGRRPDASETDLLAALGEALRGPAFPRLERLAVPFAHLATRRVAEQLGSRLGGRELTPALAARLLRAVRPGLVIADADARADFVLEVD